MTKNLTEEEKKIANAKGKKVLLVVAMVFAIVLIYRLLLIPHETISSKMLDGKSYQMSTIQEMASGV